MNREEDIAPKAGERPPDFPSNNRPVRLRAISSFAYGWVAAVSILTIYMIGSNLTIVLFADSISQEKIDISTPNLFTASIIGQTLFLLLPTIIFAWNGPLPIREALRLKRTSFRYFILAGVGVLVARVLGAFWLILQELYLIPAQWMPEYLRLQKSSQWLNEHLQFGSNIPLLLFAILAAAIIPAISEEMVFRGIVQRSFEERLKPVPAILLAASIFGAVHIQPTNFIPLAGIGAFLGLIAWSSESIWPALFGHFFFNAAQIILSGIISVSAISALDADAQRRFTTNDLLSTMPIALISLLILIAIIRQLRRMREAKGYAGIFLRDFNS